MKTIFLAEASMSEKQGWLQHAIAPRPIAFASTIDAGGNVNLSPFSFFNLFSYSPPIIIFSTTRKIRDNSTKHTLQNIMETGEVVINICEDNMVQQVSLSSCDYPKSVDEFIKAGFTRQAATVVKPPMVKESRIKLECKVQEIKSLGENGGAGQLIIAEVICMHVDESVLTEDGKMIDQQKVHHIARLGGDWYCRIDALVLFRVPKPNVLLGIGMDALPQSIRVSTLLTGNQLAMLANVQEVPAIDPTFEDDRLKNIIQYYAVSPDEMEKELHLYAAELLANNQVNEAWQVLLATAS